MELKRLESALATLGVPLPRKVQDSISATLNDPTYIKKHAAFLVDMSTNKIIAHDMNVYLKTSTFPFTIHAEVQTLTKYYRMRTQSKCKKMLIVVKLSKTGHLGGSRCCLGCMRFIRNNMDNINIKKVFYSDTDGQLVQLHKKDMIDEQFSFSTGYLRRDGYSERVEGS